MSKSKDTANYLASRFFGANISLEKKYALTSTHFVIVRYICDSIDKTHAKHKKFETHIFQKQIARFTYLSRKTVNKELKHLFKIKLFRYVKSTDGKNNKKNTYTLGRLLHAWNRRLQEKEVSLKVTNVRSVTLGYTSNSSNLTNNSKRLTFKNQKPKAAADVDKQTTSYQGDTYVKKELSEDGKRHFEKAMMAAGSRRIRARENNPLPPDKT